MNISQLAFNCRNLKSNNKQSLERQDNRNNKTHGNVDKTVSEEKAEKPRWCAGKHHSPQQERTPAGGAAVEEGGRPRVLLPSDSAQGKSKLRHEILTPSLASLPSGCIRGFPQVSPPFPFSTLRKMRQIGYH